MNVGSTGGAAAAGSMGGAGASAAPMAKGTEAAASMQGSDAKSAGNNLTDNSINQTVNNYTNINIEDNPSQMSTSGFVVLHNSCSESQSFGSLSSVEPVGQTQDAGLDMEKLIEMIIMMMMLKMMNEMMGGSSAGSSGLSG